MENKKLKEMFAVVFTFAVMGIIGLSLYQPDETVMEKAESDKAKLAAAAILASEEHNDNNVDNASSSQTILLKSNQYN